MVLYWVLELHFQRKSVNRAMNFSNNLILPATLLGPGVYSASKRNEYQEQKINVSGEYSAAGAWGRQI
jgi:hypothetical protein